MNNDLVSLRREMRAKRRALNDAEVKDASARAANALCHHRLFRRVRYVACYLPNDGELSPLPIMETAWRMGKQVYLPVLSETHHNHLLFAPYEAGDPLEPNIFGILEPVKALHEHIPLMRLDMVLTPLVAFDGRGNRLGMGGGFYDRTFAFLRRRRRWIKPRLVGMAHGFQEVEGLSSQPWDVPLQGILTEQGLRLF
jgi:5-formyltetrahydrofolate cyclo-ligase